MGFPKMIVTYPLMASVLVGDVSKIRMFLISVAFFMVRFWDAHTYVYSRAAVWYDQVQSKRCYCGVGVLILRDKVHGWLPRLLPINI